MPIIGKTLCTVDLLLILSSAVYLTPTPDTSARNQHNQNTLQPSTSCKNKCQSDINHATQLHTINMATNEDEIRCRTNTDDIETTSVRQILLKSSDCKNKSTDADGVKVPPTYDREVRQLRS